MGSDAEPVTDAAAVDELRLLDDLLRRVDAAAYARGVPLTQAAGEVIRRPS